MNPFSSSKLLLFYTNSGYIYNFKFQFSIKKTLFKKCGKEWIACPPIVSELMQPNFFTWTSNLNKMTVKHIKVIFETVNNHEYHKDIAIWIEIKNKISLEETNLTSKNIFCQEYQDFVQTLQDMGLVHQTFIMIWSIFDIPNSGLLSKHIKCTEQGP